MWLAHGVRGDFTDYSGTPKLAARPNWQQPAESATIYRLLVGAVATATPVLLGVHGRKLAAQKQYL